MLLLLLSVVKLLPISLEMQPLLLLWNVKHPLFGQDERKINNTCWYERMEHGYYDCCGGILRIDLFFVPLNIKIVYIYVRIILHSFISLMFHEQVADFNLYNLIVGENLKSSDV